MDKEARKKLDDLKMFANIYVLSFTHEARLVTLKKTFVEIHEGCNFEIQIDLIESKIIWCGFDFQDFYLMKHVVGSNNGFLFEPSLLIQMALLLTNLEKLGFEIT